LFIPSSRFGRPATHDNCESKIIDLTLEFSRWFHRDHASFMVRRDM